MFSWNKTIPSRSPNPCDDSDTICCFNGEINENLCLNLSLLSAQLGERPRSASTGPAPSGYGWPLLRGERLCKLASDIHCYPLLYIGLCNFIHDLLWPLAVFGIFWYQKLALNKGNFKKTSANKLNICTGKADFIVNWKKWLPCCQPRKIPHNFNLKLRKDGSPSALIPEFYPYFFSKCPGSLFSSFAQATLHVCIHARRKFTEHPPREHSAKTVCWMQQFSGKIINIQR